MLQSKSVFLAGVYSSAAAIIASVIFLPVFGRWYVYIFKPVPMCGLFGLGCPAILGVIQNAIFAYLFFLPLFIVLLVPRKQWLVWLILIFIPFTMVLVGGRKHLLWFIIFTLVGGLVGWLVKLAVKKLSKKARRCSD